MRCSRKDNARCAFICSGFFDLNKRTNHAIVSTGTGLRLFGIVSDLISLGRYCHLWLLRDLALRSACGLFVNMNLP